MLGRREETSLAVESIGGEERRHETCKAVNDEGVNGGRSTLKCMWRFSFALLLKRTGATEKLQRPQFSDILKSDV